MKHLLWLVVLLLVAGCGPRTHSGGVSKTYKTTIEVGESASAWFFMGVDADTAAETMAGDAPATSEVKVPVSAAFKGAQSGATTEGSTRVEGTPTNIEPIDASTKSSTPVPTPSITPTPKPIPNPVIEPSNDVTGYKYKMDARRHGKTHVEGNYPELYIWPFSGPVFGSNLLIKCSDGQELKVPNTSHGSLIKGSLSSGVRRYLAGAPYYASSNPNEHQTMEYVAEYSNTSATRPDSCTAFFDNKVDGAADVLSVEPGLGGGDYKHSLAGQRYDPPRHHISIDQKLYDRWYWPEDGPEYGKKILIQCSDGQSLKVSNTGEGYLIGGGGRKYIAGEPIFKTNEAPGTFPTMEYYAAYGTNPDECVMFYNGK